MKKVITKVSATWEGETMCEEEYLTDKKLNQEEEDLKYWVINELGLDDEMIKACDIQITFEVREV